MSSLFEAYITNLGKYNEGELVGDWFEPPIDYDEMAERIGLNEFYEEYAIHDYELPFEIDEYTPIEEVNRLCEMGGGFAGSISRIIYVNCKAISAVLRICATIRTTLSITPAAKIWRM